MDSGCRAATWSNNRQCIRANALSHGYCFAMVLAGRRSTLPAPIMMLFPWHMLTLIGAKRTTYIVVVGVAHGVKVTGNGIGSRHTPQYGGLDDRAQLTHAHGLVGFPTTNATLVSAEGAPSRGHRVAEIMFCHRLEIQIPTEDPGLIQAGL